MALIITEEQKMLKDSASELFMAKATVIQMRKLRDTQYTPFDQSLWEEMVAMGWTALTVPENYNGLDFGFVGLGQILEEAGKNLSKSPLISSILLGASALRLSDNEALKVRSFPGVMEGTSQLAFAIQEGKHHQTTSFKTQACFSCCPQQIKLLLHKRYIFFDIGFTWGCGIKKGRRISKELSVDSSPK